MKWTPTSCAVLLDRDDTANKEVEYLRAPEELRLPRLATHSPHLEAIYYCPPIRTRDVLAASPVPQCWHQLPKSAGLTCGDPLSWVTRSAACAQDIRLLVGRCLC